MAMRMTQAAPIMFGAGSLEVLGMQLKMRGLKKPIIVTDKGVTAAGVTDKVVKVIKDAELEYAIYDDCLSDAPTDSITVAANAIRDAKADAIIALGGGSSMDTAKAASLIIKDPKPITELIGKPPGKPDLPIITIPTTAGTGSEVTIVGVLSNSETHKKSGVVITGADVAIVDPELTVGVPPAITAATGMDVVAHAVEAVTGKQRNPLSDLKGFEALRLVAAHLPAAVADGSNIVAREGMSLASTLAGMAFTDSITTLGHAISQAVASVYPIHHGLICGLATPPQLELFASAVPERVRKIAVIFGADVPYDATNEQIGKIAANQMRQFMRSIGIQSLEQLGYTRKQMVDLTDVLMQEMMIRIAPCEIDRDAAERALGLMCDYQGA